MAQVKGTAVIASLRFVREQFGEEGLERVLAALPDEDRSAFDANLLASSWYPMPALLHFMEETQKQFEAQEPEVLRKMGRRSADYGLTTVYKIFFKVGSPEFIVRKASRVFGSYYDTGEMVQVENAPGRAVVELKGFAGAPQYCARIFGWMERTMVLAGARNLKSSHSSCVHRGDQVCRFEGNWEA
jgi:hypothetical protein